MNQGVRKFYIQKALYNSLSDILLSLNFNYLRARASGFILSLYEVTNTARSSQYSKA